MTKKKKFIIIIKVEINMSKFIKLLDFVTIYLFVYIFLILLIPRKNIKEPRPNEKILILMIKKTLINLIGFKVILIDSISIKKFRIKTKAIEVKNKKL